MASAETTVVRLSDLQDGQEAECFAALVRKTRGTTYKNEPFIKCQFRDKRVTLEAPLWADHRLLNQAEQWVEGIAYRLRVKAALKPKYGLQLDILEIRQATPGDAEDGYDFYDLVESTDQEPERLWNTIRDCIDRYIEDEPLRRLVRLVLQDNEPLFRKMQAATSFHHNYTGGLLEHVWSMTRIAGFLADHYAKYYHELNPPLNKGVIVAAAILHDIGKLRELEYNAVEAKYTKLGCLIGHVQMGRDMVREAAPRVEGLSEETLMLLEHAILSHHGQREFGAPVLPQTLEALIVSYVDILDAKVNAAARGRLLSVSQEDFTDRIFPLDNRRIYKGIPLEMPLDEPPPTEP